MAILDPGFRSHRGSVSHVSPHPLVTTNPSLVPPDVFADLLTAKGHIGGFGLGVSVLIGVAYLMFLRIPGVLFILIWGLLFGVLAILAGAGAMLYQTSEMWAAEEEPRVHNDGQINAAQYLSYIMFGEDSVQHLWISDGWTPELNTPECTVCIRKIYFMGFLRYVP